MVLQFYHCPICGNIIVKVVDSGVIPFCCGSEMQLLKPKTEEEFKEKHLPVVEKLVRKIYVVRVGESPHPMSDEHYIRFVCLQTENGFDLQYLKPGDLPESIFMTNAKPENVFEFCNRHGLWIVDLDEKPCETCIG